MPKDDTDLQEWVEFARQSFENDLARLMAKKDMRRKHLAVNMDVSAPRVSQMLGRSNNYKLQTLVKIARGVGAVLEIRLADETSEVVRVVDVATARNLDNAEEQRRRVETALPDARDMLLWWREEDFPPMRSADEADASGAPTTLVARAGANG